MARIAVIGQIHHDTIMLLDRFPASGGTALIAATTTTAGGSTANTAVALARLGEAIALRAVIANDVEGDELLGYLVDEGIDCGMITRVDGTTRSSTILLDSHTGERTTLRREGAMLRKGDRLDIAKLFDHDVVILDVADTPLRRFLTDLPAHTRPDVRLLGPIAHIVENAEADAIETAFRFDTIVGTERQFIQLLEVDHADDLPMEVQRRMPGANLRAAVVTNEDQSCRWITRDERGTTPAFVVDANDTIGACDALIAGIAWSMARRLPWPKATRFANAVAALSTRSIGVQASLPTLDEVEHLLGE